MVECYVAAEKRHVQILGVHPLVVLAEQYPSPSSAGGIATSLLPFRQDGGLGHPRGRPGPSRFCYNRQTSAELRSNSHEETLHYRTGCGDLIHQNTLLVSQQLRFPLKLLMSTEQKIMRLVEEARRTPSFSTPDGSKCRPPLAASVSCSTNNNIVRRLLLRRRSSAAAKEQELAKASLLLTDALAKSPTGAYSRMKRCYSQRHDYIPYHVARCKFLRKDLDATPQIQRGTKQQQCDHQMEAPISFADMPEDTDYTHSLVCIVPPSVTKKRFYDAAHMLTHQ